MRRYLNRQIRCHLRFFAPEIDYIYESALPPRGYHVDPGHPL
jgi:hypothetical protein